MLSHFCWYLLQILVKHSTLLRIKEPSLPTDFWDTDPPQVVPLKVGSAEPLVKPLLTQSRTIKLAFSSRCDIPTNPGWTFKTFQPKRSLNEKKRNGLFFQTDSAKKFFFSVYFNETRFRETFMGSYYKTMRISNIRASPKIP